MARPVQQTWATGWLSRWRNWRNARISDPHFQQAAMEFFPSRPFARGRAEALYDLVAGFVYSQTLLACVELDVFEALAEGPLEAHDLAARIGLDASATARLAQAAASLDLLEVTGDGYGLGPLGAAVRGAPGVAEMIRHHRVLYRDLSDPVALLSGQANTELSRFWAYVGGAQTLDLDEATAKTYSDLMAASQAMVAEETLATVPLTKVERMLDVGGGDGAFAEAALRAAPDLQACVFDLPAVADRARGRFERAGLAGRGSAIGGNFLEGSLPGGFDAISLVRVLYDHDDPVVRELLRRAHAALPPGGMLLVSEPMSGGKKPLRAGDAYFGFYTAAMGTGQPRSRSRHAEMLRDAGFVRVADHPTRQRFITSVVTARRA